MLRLRDIMTATDLVTLDPQLTIREAMEVFASRSISGAPVVAGGAVIGVVSVTDLIRLTASLSGVPTAREQSPDLLDEPDDTVEEPRRHIGPTDDPSGVFFTDLWDDAG